MNTNIATPITPRGIEVDITAARPFAALDAARDLLRTARRATIATLDPVSGYPYAMVTNVTTEADGTPFFYVAGLAIHARNILADNRVSLALSEPGAADTLTRPRMTLAGRAHLMKVSDATDAREKYASLYPKSKLYLELQDALFCRIQMEALQLNGGPAQNANELTVEALKTDLSGAEQLMGAARSEINRLNGSGEELASLVALAVRRPGNWRVTGLDPDGIELSTPDETVRHWFSRRVVTLAELANEIRPT